MADDATKYLKPSFMAESDSNEIKILANRIVGKKRGKEAVHAIFNWVRDNVDYDIADVVGARGVLKRKPMRAVCIDKVNLTVALCRAAGIPARYLGLDVKLRTKKDIPVVKHMITEVYYNKRWHKIDSSFGKSCLHFIPASKFGSISNWRRKSKYMVFDKLPWWLVPLTWVMYRFDPTMLKIKSGVRKK